MRFYIKYILITLCIFLLIYLKKDYDSRKLSGDIIYNKIGIENDFLRYKETKVEVFNMYNRFNSQQNINAILIEFYLHKTKTALVLRSDSIVNLFSPRNIDVNNEFNPLIGKLSLEIQKLLNEEFQSFKWNECPPASLLFKKDKNIHLYVHTNEGVILNTTISVENISTPVVKSVSSIFTEIISLICDCTIEIEDLLPI
jgi:hypothetical protein